ncbi:uncharacterized protein B0J16DRAFT_340254 [Fusarium flagelliforme]|uniref:uncharacterized protein n=1 Tax=Fusarium flagelliforme TaxID=2675880 RepID=UPI001E8D6C12|nr:uncharacterized protein B0J16DRAFT_340254 [Fusarium flagelliforme]KAH7184632.1 hypothetical protein B0J16DRAFT_340254 [Fusarium flagelliforme]
MVAIKSALTLLALGAHAALAVSDVICSSELGTKSIQSNKIPRATTTVSERITIVKKFIRKVNVVVVARPYTTTETTTVQTTVISTADPDVKTATSHVTETQTEIEDRSHTAFSTTIISTTTTKYNTQTIPAPPGFTKIRDSPDYVKRADIPNAIPFLPAGRAGAPEQYVQRIRCTKVPVTSTKYTTTTIQGPRKTIRKTNTRLVSTTETVTETEYPDDVTTTVTETSSPTVTEYNDVTSTSTMIESVTVETQLPVELYLACSEENIISTANGGKALFYRNTIGITYDTLAITGMANAYECCAACMKNPKCLSSITAVSNSANCYHYVSRDNVCPNGQVKWSSYFTRNGASPGWLWSNGPCGSYVNGGNRD